MSATEEKQAQNPANEAARKVFYLPKTDLIESKEEYKLLIDLPGVKKDQLSLTLERGQLSVEGLIGNVSPQKPLQGEYTEGHYQRHFKLSPNIDPKTLEAKLEEGVLEITLKKIPEAQPRQILVS